MPINVFYFIYQDIQEYVLMNLFFFCKFFLNLNSFVITNRFLHSTYTIYDEYEGETSCKINFKFY